MSTDGRLRSVPDGSVTWRTGPFAHMPTLSVALCTYNGGAYLQAQLDSIAGQTRVPDELVVRDDGSTDGSPDVLQAFARSAPFPVRVLPTESNLGYVKNFETVIGACTGDLIALSDQDDVWLPGKLDALERALADDPDVLLAFSDASLVGPELEPLGRTMWESLGLDARERGAIERGGASSPLVRSLYVTGATVCFRRSLVSLALPIDLPHWHDGWLALVATAYGQVVAVDQPLVLYRQHGANTLGAPRYKRRSVPVVVLQTLWERLTSRRPARLHEAQRKRETNAFLKNLVLYARAAQDRLSDSPWPGFADRLALRADHLERRVAVISRPLIPKLGAILKSGVSGHYHKVDVGSRAILSDLYR